ncbi:MAG: pyroglutamyl-peptidase I [Flexilinea sp.]|nr:pyroglutamyl-peptidase I [Flexilinea sp.]
MKILVTSFEPFGGDKLNSAQEALRFVPDEIRGAKVVKRCLPVAFGRSAAVLREALRSEKPDAVLCLGQAGGRKALTPERVAINLEDARLPDNDGCQPVDEAIDPDGPDAYFSTLPAKSMVRAIRNAGLPAEISNSAGTFVCNRVMYGLLDCLAHEFPTVRGGFLHVPYMAEQAAEHPDDPCLPREDLTRGVTAAIEAIIEQCEV